MVKIPSGVRFLSDIYIENLNTIGIKLCSIFTQKKDSLGVYSHKKKLADIIWTPNLASAETKYDFNKILNYLV